MRDRRGFTLVELLAVIVIIGILAIVVVPSVTGYISNTRNETYNSHEKAMMEAAKSYTVECLQGTNQCTLPAQGRKNEVYLDELIQKEYIEKLQDPTGKKEFCDAEKSYVIINNKSGNYEYESCLFCSGYATNSPNCELKQSSIDVQDNTPPICGEVENANTTWTKGARTVTVGCSDPESGCMRDKFSVLFKDSTSVGHIEIKNRSSNTNAKTTVCNVNVYIDNTEPTCELEVVGGTQEGEWVSGDNIVVKFTSKEDAHSGLLTYGIGTSYKTPDYNKQDSYRINTATGTTTIFGYVKDKAGNEGMCSKTIRTGIARPQFDIYYGYQLMPLKERYTVSGMSVTDNGVVTTSSTTPKITFTGMSKYPNVKRAVIVTNGTSLENAANYKLTYGSTTISSMIKGNRIEFELPKGTYDTYAFTLGSTSGKTINISRIELEVATANLPTNKAITVNLIPKTTEVIKTTEFSFDNGGSFQSNYYKDFDTSGAATSGNAKTKNDIGMISDSKPYTVGKMDKVGPTINSLTPNTTSPTANDVILTGKAIDSTSGIIEYAFTKNSSLGYYSSEWQKITLTKNEISKQSSIVANSLIYFYVKDEAGNYSKKDIQIGFIDKVKPVCSPVSDYATLKCEDKSTAESTASGIVGWYYGKTNTTTGTYNTIGATTTMNINATSTVTSAGTYYLYVKDRANNISNVVSDVYYTVTYNGNGGSTPTRTSEIRRKTQTATLNSSSTKTGYTFKGWNTDSHATTTQSNVVVNGNTTLYAIFQNNAYTINFVGNTNTGGSTAAKTCTYDVDCTLPTNGFTKTGYLFDGWTYNGNTYADGAKVKNLATSGSVTFTAKWKPIKFYVTFNGNGATSGSMSKMTCTYDQNCTLTSNAFARTGYTYDHWATSSGGAKVYSNGQNIKNATATNEATVALYARWNANGYTVAFNGNGNSGGSTASKSCTYDANCVLTSNGFTKTGYGFTGWATSSGGGVAYSNGATVKNLTTSGTYNLYAKWGANTYTVAFNGNGNTGGSTASKSCTYDANCVLTSNGFSRTGYTFAGWATSSGGSATYSNGATVRNLTTSGTITLYAKWNANTYTVAFNGNGATGGSTGSRTCTYDQYCSLPGNGFSRTGYSFAGWAKSSGGGVAYGNGAQVRNLTTSGTYTLYAKWNVNQYSCSGGYYLRAGATSCTQCPGGSWCPGGTWTFNTGSNQGINSCPGGYTNGAGQSRRSSCYYNASVRDYTATRYMCRVSNNPTYEIQTSGSITSGCPPYNSSYIERYYTCNSSYVNQTKYKYISGTTTGYTTRTESFPRSGSCSSALTSYGSCQIVATTSECENGHYGSRCCVITNCTTNSSMYKITYRLYRYTGSGSLRCQKGICAQVDHWTASWQTYGTVTTGGCGSAPSCSGQYDDGKIYDSGCTPNYYCPSGGNLSNQKCYAYD